MKRHKVVFTIEVDICHEEGLLPDDEWREHFYAHINDHSKLAAHLAFNLGINEGSLSMLDGFADRNDHEAFVENYSIVECEVEELEDE